MDAIKKNIRYRLASSSSSGSLPWIDCSRDSKITSGKQEDLVFGSIIVFILMPIVVGGLATFGLYSLKGEYSADKNNFGIRKKISAFPDFGKLKSQF